MPSREFTMTSPAPACASDASLDENRIPFFFGPASLLIPFLIFALLSVYLFVVLKVFDLMALAGAGLTALVAGALLTKKPMRYWKAVLEGAASPMTATVLLLLMAAGVFSAMMKAAAGSPKPSPPSRAAPLPERRCSLQPFFSFHRFWPQPPAAPFPRFWLHPPSFCLSALRSAAMCR